VKRKKRKRTKKEEEEEEDLGEVKRFILNKGVS
jgi:hypothetical protein